MIGSADTSPARTEQHTQHYATLDLIRSFTQSRISHQFTGNDVTNPTSMASRITAENTGVSTAAAPSNQAGRIANCAIAIVAYMPTCQALSDSTSARD